MRSILIIVLAVGLVGYLYDRQNRKDNLTAANTATAEAQLIAQKEKDCEGAAVKYRELMEQKSFLAAHMSIGSCARIFPDKYVSLETAALVPLLIADIYNKAESASFRLNQFTRLDAIDKSLADKHRHLIPTLNALVKVEEQKRIQAIAKQKKSEGVRLGMTPADVEASSWGKPQRINTSTSARGVKEQWVYGLRHYLYFENGVLTSIQN
jgi:hypothetical protein